MAANSQSSHRSLVDDSWELIDPNPDIHELFAQFNREFFWGRLGSVYVQWSPRMTLCAGLCRYHGRNGECSIHLSKPLLSLRPRKDLVETLLHEMIHAFLFVADNDRERESHGPKFHEHMYRINRLTGANITVYHTFNDEVDYYKTHWWKCNGPCQYRHPFYGIVKRSMNRAPGPHDFWYKDHQANCGGQFIKIKEPAPKTTATKRKKETKTSPPSQDENKLKKITNYFTPSAGSGSATPSTSATPEKFNTKPTNSSDPFGSSGFVLGSIGNSNASVGNPGSSGGASASISSSSVGGTKLGGSGSHPPPATFSDPFGSSGFVLGSIGNSSASVGNPSLGGGASASTSSSSVGGTKLGGSGSHPPRRGEHPLLAKWAQNHRDAAKGPSNQFKGGAGKGSSNQFKGDAGKGPSNQFKGGAGKGSSNVFNGDAGKGLSNQVKANPVQAMKTSANDKQGVKPGKKASSDIPAKSNGRQKFQPDADIEVIELD